jgi:hypothetical protein
MDEEYELMQLGKKSKEVAKSEATDREHQEWLDQVAPKISVIRSKPYMQSGNPPYEDDPDEPTDPGDTK